MEFDKVKLVHQLGDEFILGMDIFDVDDIWDILHNETVDQLKALADEIRAYVNEKYCLGVTHTAEFIERQLTLWVFQYTWRYSIKTENGK